MGRLSKKHPSDLGTQLLLVFSVTPQPEIQCRAEFTRSQTDREMLLERQADQRAAGKKKKQMEGQAGEATKMSTIPVGVSHPHPLLIPSDSEHRFISKHRHNSTIGSVITDSSVCRINTLTN